MPRLKPVAGRVALVTGATSGVGLVTATELARRGATVHLLARDSARAAAARRLITANSGNNNISYDLADLCDFDSVWQYATTFRTRYNRLDVLIHNAAKVYPSYQENRDGLELTFAGQVVGPFLLTWLLLPDLLAAAPSRVIVVCSAGMYAQPLTRSMAPVGPERYRARSAYAKAQRAQVALSAEWAKRVPSEDIAFHAMQPGRTGADTIVWLATAGCGQLRSGLFWHDRRPRPVQLAPLPDPAAARNASSLWDYVADLARQ
ncbi:MAG TPA: SDR family NAD(P)-dependent oxidoreductase [Streptosporangiaceae bacterium]|nr:SDR family NAD(P)-dependent oxidoreductase [Streptosporangiaceae bacterium]